MPNQLVKKLFFALLPPTIVFGVNAIWMIFGFYAFYRHTDSVFHVFGGMAIAYTVNSLLQLFFKEKELGHYVIHRLLILTSTATVAVFWEFGEYLAEVFFGLRLQNGIGDTMKDLALGMIGAIIFIRLFLQKKK